MADQQLLQLFLNDAIGWKKWRAEHPQAGFDFTEADLRNKDLRNAFLIGVNCYRACFDGADLRNADLRGAYGWQASFRGADLSEAQMSEAGFVSCDFAEAAIRDAVIADSDISGSHFEDADLRGTSLRGTRMVRTDFSRANLTGCKVYGASVWDVVVSDTIEQDLVITAYQEPEITVDSLEVAQFLYLLLRNEKLRNVIDTITAKVVLLLGRFSTEEKALLDQLRTVLRAHNYLPVVFDFTKPASRDLTETVSTLAHLSRFVIAVLTNPRSIPHELATIVPHLRSVPVQPLIKRGEKAYGMFDDLSRYRTVLPTVEYDGTVDITTMAENLIASCEDRARVLQG